MRCGLRVAVCSEHGRATYTGETCHVDLARYAVFRARLFGKKCGYGEWAKHEWAKHESEGPVVHKSVIG